MVATAAQMPNALVNANLPETRLEFWDMDHPPLSGHLLPRVHR